MRRPVPAHPPPVGLPLRLSSRLGEDGEGDGGGGGGKGAKGREEGRAQRGREEVRKGYELLGKRKRRAKSLNVLIMKGMKEEGMVQMRTAALPIHAENQSYSFSPGASSRSLPLRFHPPPTRPPQCSVLLRCALGCGVVLTQTCLLKISPIR